MSPQLMNAFTRGSLYTKDGSKDEVVVVKLRLLLGGMNLCTKNIDLYFFLLLVTVIGVPRRRN